MSLAFDSKRCVVPSILILPVIAFTAWVAPATAQSPEPQLPKGYIGSETCQPCHERVAGIFRRDPHFSIDSGRSKADLSREWKGRACEACHGPGQEHMEKAEGKDIFIFGGSIRTPKPAAASEVNPRCLKCHAGDDAHSGRTFGSHNRNQISCTQCHTVHQAGQRPLLAVEPNTLCQSCHANVMAEFTRPYRHRLPEGAMQCVDCHNPHGSMPPREMRRVSANEVACLKCHGDKRGPFPFEHPPVRTSPCSTCHEPHGSSNPRMLIRHEQRFLCLECHTASMGTLAATPPAFHDLRNPRFRNCTMCHSKIHGSYVSRDLLR